MERELQMLIAGELVGGESRLDVVNPATGQIVRSVARASERQAADAVAAAKSAFPAWAALPRVERGRCLERLADAVSLHADEIAHLLTEEQGKPIGDARGEIAGTIMYLRYFAGADLPVEVIQDDDAVRVELHHKPLGVVVGIVPWNFPVLIAMNKTASALIMGNTVVLKPAPTTPASTLMIGELAADIFPAGVLNVIADANDLGGFLTGHPDVAKVTFTGSTATGKKIAANGAATLKRLTLELGGNDAAIVLDDVDVKSAAPQIAAAAFRNAGQICVAIKRLYVPSSLYDEMCEAIAAHADGIAWGDGLTDGVTMGPVQNARQFANAERYLDVARRDGKIIAGGAAQEGEGFFIQPTVVRDIADDSPLVAEEQFSPILPILRYDDLGDAIRRANDTRMGLGGSVWSASIERAHDCARQLDTGTVWINQHGAGGNPAVPFGGAKESGVGVEFGDVGLAEYTQPTVVNMAKKLFAPTASRNEDHAAAAPDLQRAGELA